MDPDIKQLLEENLKLSKENHEMLLKVRSVQRWAQITRALYWFVIVAAALGAFYFLKPYFGNLLNIYTGGVSGINNISDIKNSLSEQNQVQNLLKELNQ